MLRGLLILLCSMAIATAIVTQEFPTYQFGIATVIVFADMGLNYWTEKEKR